MFLSGSTSVDSGDRLKSCKVIKIRRVYDHPVKLWEQKDYHPM